MCINDVNIELYKKISNIFRYQKFFQKMIQMYSNKVDNSSIIDNNKNSDGRSFEKDAYGNPIERDQFGNPIQNRDQYGNPISNNNPYGNDYSSSRWNNSYRG